MKPKNHSRGFAVSLLLVLFLTIVGNIHSQSSDEPVGSKTILVQKGDTLSSISKEHLSNPSRWRELLKYNNIPNPNLIRPGLKLVIPEFLSKEPIARANFVLGKVDYKKGEGDQSWNQLQKNEELFPLDTIRTSSNGKADLTIKGTGLVRVHPTSLVQIKYLQNKTASPSVELRKGSLDAFISKIFIKGKERTGEKIRIVTPSATAAVRGTKFSVELDSNENSTVSCFDGIVAVSAENKTVELKKGFASFVEKGKKPSEPYKIPLPPSLKENE